MAHACMQHACAPALLPPAHHMTRAATTRLLTLGYDSVDDLILVMVARALDAMLPARAQRQGRGAFDEAAGVPIQSPSSPLSASASSRLR